MGLVYNKINPGEARDIFRQMRQAQKPGYGLGVNKPTGEFLGPLKLDEIDPEETNAMGGYDTHFAATGSRAGSICKLLEDDKCLVKEMRDVRERYGDGPQLALENGVLQWFHNLNVHGKMFPVRVIYPKNFPDEAVSIKVPIDFPPSTPHLSRDNVLSWSGSWEEKKNCNRWQSVCGTAAEAFAVAHQWLLAFMVWDAIGEWPVLDALAPREVETPTR